MQTGKGTGKDDSMTTQENINKIINADALEALKLLDDDSIDSICSDPPYSISFMQKKWDNDLPSVAILKECLRVLKPGAWAMWLMTPRQDSQTDFLIRLREAGFNISFTSMSWIYLNGFPKAGNTAKLVDRKLGVESEIVGTAKSGAKETHHNMNMAYEEGKTSSLMGGEYNLTKAVSPEAKALEGSYLGFQPKPSFETVIVSMKPLGEKSYIDQALKNGHGITWLDDCRIPTTSADEVQDRTMIQRADGFEKGWGMKPQGKVQVLEVLDLTRGRFPANILVQDNAIDIGAVKKAGEYKGEGSGQGGIWQPSMGEPAGKEYGDEGDISRYFSLDSWWDEKLKELPKEVQKIFPFLYCPKAGKAEREEGLEDMPVKSQKDVLIKTSGYHKDGKIVALGARHNVHPSVKPIELMCYLITLTSRKDDIILDPFLGSGTTAISARMLSRRFIGSERDKEYYDIAQGRLHDYMSQLKLGEVSQ